MKDRIKTDSAILSFFIIVTGLLYQFPGLYRSNLVADDMLDFLGLFIVLWGNFLRMAGRGFKKEHSQKSEGLVTAGPYALTRNPMYLGSFLMGAGFIFIVWPWWGIFAYALLFYVRFNKQMSSEEKFLAEKFGASYLQYQKDTPRIFPRWKNLKQVNFQEAFPFESSWNTKEKLGLFAWPVLAMILEIFQEKVVYDTVNIGNALYVFLLGVCSFILMAKVLYKK